MFTKLSPDNPTDSKDGVNPLEGWKPSVPAGSAFELGTPEYTKMEKKGIRELGKVGFVLVAGGLGERLGYGGAKVCGF
jgi:UDP-sugar pyrophosphorylase